jgi:hypothetical protein
MKAQRLLLVLAAVAVVGLVLGLMWSLRSTEPSVQPVALPREPAPTPTPTPAPAPAPAAPEPPTRPALGANDPPVRLEPEETVDDQGRIVRDHRGLNEVAPPSPLIPLSVEHVHAAVNPTLRACAHALPQRPAQPARVTVHTTVHVSAGRITVSDVTLDGADGLGADYAACVKKGLADVSADAPAEQPSADERVHIPFTVAAAEPSSP